MSKYTRDTISGAAILADRAAVEQYMSKKDTEQALQSLVEEINSLRQQLQSLRTEIEKR